jgi:hypothetical protein
MCAPAYDSTDGQREALTGLTSEKSTTPGRMWMRTWCPDDRREEAFLPCCTISTMEFEFAGEKKIQNQTPPFFASELEL